MDYLLRNAHTSFDQPLGKSSIANRALKRKNPFSSVEGNRPLIQRQFIVPKKVVAIREALVKKLFSGVSGLNCHNTTTIYCAEEGGLRREETLW